LTKLGTLDAVGGPYRNACVLVIVCIAESPGLVDVQMAAAEESSSSTSTQQQEDLDPIMLLAQDMFHKTADYLNGEFDSTYLPF